MNLKGYRASKDISTTDVANALGVCRETYRKKEKGLIGISLEEGFKIAEVLGLTIEEVYDAVKETKSKN